MRSARHSLCLGLSLLITTVIITAAALFTWLTDPFLLYHQSEYIPPPDMVSLVARGRLSSYSYVTKFKRIAVEKPQRLLLGSSIVDHGIRTRGTMALWYGGSSEERKRLLALSGPLAEEYYNAAIRG